ncbi:hypothetical protein LINPERPRIM_LOCUS23290 [Linum perenne]
MSTTWTSPSCKIMRWRVRDWVSCFLASRIPLDDNPESNFHASAPQIRNMVRDFNGGGGGGSQCRYHNHHHSKRRNKRRKERRVEDTISDEIETVADKSKEASPVKEAMANSDVVNNNSKDMPSKDLRAPTETASVEDYIVFCFGENGAFEVVKDCRNRSRHRSTKGGDDHHGKSLVAAKSSSSATKHTVSRKLNYGDQEIISRLESCEKRSTSINGEVVGSDVEPEVVIHLHEVGSTVYKLPLSSLLITMAHSLLLFLFSQNNDETTSKEIRHPLEEMDGSQLGDAEHSSDSNQSDGSSSDSFSFPVLRWEEMVGSPIQMPKPEDFHLRKQRMNCARFQCCRF